MRTDQFLGSSNEKLLSLNVDLAEERREVAAVRSVQYQQRLRQGFEKGVKVREFILGDLVLQKVVGSMKNPSWGKLSPNWKGSYWVTSVAGTGTYWLKDLDGVVIPRPWNINNLRKYYF